jgi:cell division protein ZapA (FtsZ GTPase activity inhibitor)
MEELAVTIKIGQREYPMKVHPTDEACVRKAGKLINAQMQHYKEQFGVKDQQDLLAMVAFDCLVENLKLQNHPSIDENQIREKINRLIHLIQANAPT